MPQKAVLPTNHKIECIHLNDNYGNRCDKKAKVRIKKRKG